METYAAIFDMDGVLIDSYRPHYEAWRRSCGQRGITFTEEDFAKTFGQTNDQVIPVIQPGIGREELEAWAEEKEALFREVIAEELPVMEGARELLGALAAEENWRLAVGSSAPRANIDAVLAGMGEGGIFGAVVASEDIREGKPDPEVFRKAAQRLGVPPERCLVLEDSLAGVEAGCRAGMAVVALTGTAERTALERRARMVVDSLTELQPALLLALIEDHRADSLAQ